jgi:hypothetical protein
MTRDRSTGRASGQDKTTFLGLGLINLVVLALAIVAIVIGYVLLGRGSVTAAPLLLALGYTLLVPAALLIGFRRLKG